MVKNTINLEFHSDRPLTTAEQEAILVQIELAITEPQVWTEDGPEDTDWRLAADFDLNAEFPIVEGR